MAELLPARVPVGEYVAIGDALGVAPVLLNALSIVESLEDPRAIRREDHWWRKVRFASREAKAFDRRPNPKDMAARWDLFHQMDAVCRADAALNVKGRDAAILCHSLGWWQCMGFNHLVCGFDDARNWLAAMQTLKGQRECAIAFISSDLDMLEAFRTRNYPLIGLNFNGPNYRANRYDDKLRENVRRLETSGVTYA